LSTSMKEFSGSGPCCIVECDAVYFDRKMWKLLKSEDK
jgi:hypothetical protein